MPVRWAFGRHCWVEVNGLSDASIGEKYSWSVLKALSETVAAGALQELLLDNAL